MLYIVGMNNNHPGSSKPQSDLLFRLIGHHAKVLRFFVDLTATSLILLQGHGAMAAPEAGGCGLWVQVHLPSISLLLVQ